MSSIYEKMKQLDVEINSWQSDMYVPVTPETKAVVEKYEFKQNVSTFRSEGKFWYDIPFSYNPFWNKS